MPFYKKSISLLFILILTLLFYYSFLSRIWVAEDAYITFRHIQNFWEGYGLTFNPNSRTEGFTHPLWVFFLIFMSSFGLSLHFSSLLLGVFFTSMGMFILFYEFLYKKYQLHFLYKAVLIIPFYFIIHDGFRDFWTSGMEFSLTFFLLTILLSTIADQEIKKPMLVSFLLSMLYLNRPELGIFYIYYGIVIVLKKYQDSKFKIDVSFLRLVFQYLTPFLILGGGYHLFRWFYYKDLFPTTFYAKSAKILWQDGLYYVYYSFLHSPLLLPTLLIVLITWFFYKNKIQSKYFVRDLLPVGFHILYLISIGGDFMAYRFILPDLVILYIYFFIYFSKIIKKESLLFSINILLFFTSIYFLFVQKIHTPVLGKNQIVHEYRAYVNKTQNWKDKWFFVKHKWYDRGTIFKELQKCLEYEPFVITNSWLDAKCAPEDDYGLGYFGFAAGPEVILIDQLGITDKEVALTGKTIWNRVGHNKSISTENVIKRKVLFCSLQHKEYDSIMNTNFFPIINLEPNFLFRLGSQYPQKIQRLKELYRKLQKTSIENQEDQKVFYYLQLIETNYNIKILDLPISNPPEYKKYDTCWDLKI
ncbi:MAG: hypothetical protein ACK4UJ_03935 [Leptonema sp. (in: bacteria)]